MFYERLKVLDEVAFVWKSCVYIQGRGRVVDAMGNILINLSPKGQMDSANMLQTNIFHCGAWQ